MKYIQRSNEVKEGSVHYRICNVFIDEHWNGVQATGWGCHFRNNFVTTDDIALLAPNITFMSKLLNGYSTYGECNSASL